MRAVSTVSSSLGSKIARFFEYDSSAPKRARIFSTKVVLQLKKIAGWPRCFSMAKRMVLPVFFLQVM
ncbi:hypothetical protein OAA76_04965 [Planktotalea frisia]|nr:hypothetical protein [Planktotalea frisia]